jgi:hypothetical protein
VSDRIEHVHEVLDRVSFRDRVWRLQTTDSGSGPVLISLAWCAPDTDHPEAGDIDITGRWWVIEEHNNDDEILQTAFLAVLTAEEHEVREEFKVDGLAIYGPHQRPLHLLDTGERLSGLPVS